MATIRLALFVFHLPLPSTPLVFLYPLPSTPLSQRKTEQGETVDERMSEPSWFRGAKNPGG